MLAFIVRRLLQSTVVMAVVAFIAFAMFNYVGDPVAFMLGQDATIEERTRLRAELASRGALVATLSDEVAGLRQHLEASRLSAQAAADELVRVRQQLKLAQDEILRLDGQTTAQRGDITALKSCLGGTLHALQALATSDRFGALRHLMAVDGACRTAYRLLNVQTEAN